jgi:hypothetical protein
MRLRNLQPQFSLIVDGKPNMNVSMKYWLKKSPATVGYSLYPDMMGSTGMVVDIGGGSGIPTFRGASERT